MQVVRFTYDSTEVEISVFIFLYLRLSGIYIFERYFNLESAVCNKMLNALPDSEENEFSKAYEQYDMELYLVRNEEEFRIFQKYGYTEKTILLTLGDGWLPKLEKDFDKNRTIDCSRAGRSAKLLKSLSGCMYQNNLISHKALNSLNAIADIYCNNQVMELTFVAKYFYTAEDDKWYNGITGQYQTVTDDIFALLGKVGSEWGDESYIHLQYAALYMAYEGDLYCSRHKKPFLYTADSIAGVCDILLSKKNIKFLLGDSIHLLVAQVYSDLLKNSNKAYEHYLAACREYSAYAYYKKAVHLMENDKTYPMAVKYLSKGLNIYPAYYRAWHMLGICYMHLEQWQKAVQAFDNLEIILSPRLEHDLLRPMEIEYLFKAANQAGDILYKEMQQVSNAIEHYLFAERVWEAIDKTRFFSFVYTVKGRVAYVKSRIKRELNINKVYVSLSDIYQRLENKEKSLYYSNKLIL